MELDGDAAGAALGLESIPEVLLPVQLERGRRLDLAVGERRLLCAMLLDATTCFCKLRGARDNNARKLFREAETWIRSREDRSPFSFVAVCSVLGLSAQRLRGHLLEGVSTEERRTRLLRHAAGSSRSGASRKAPRGCYRGD
jgi:hypothetical protein